MFTLDLAATAAAIIERYSWRWPIEPSNATGKQILGAGQARSQLEAAVERTVPFGFLVQSLLIVWYARFGYDPADVGLRRLLCPWYRTKQEPAVADMLAKLRREFLKGPIFGHTARPQPTRSNRGLRLDLRHHRRITRKHEEICVPKNRYYKI